MIDHVVFCRDHAVRGKAFSYTIPVYVDVYGKSGRMLGTLNALHKKFDDAHPTIVLLKKILQDGGHIRCLSSLGNEYGGTLFQTEFAWNNLVEYGTTCNSLYGQILFDLPSCSEYEHELTFTPMAMRDYTYKPHGISATLTIRKKCKRSGWEDEGDDVNLYSIWAALESNYRDFVLALYGLTPGWIQCRPRKQKTPVLEPKRSEIRFYGEPSDDINRYIELIQSIPSRLQGRSYSRVGQP